MLSIDSLRHFRLFATAILALFAACDSGGKADVDASAAPDGAVQVTDDAGRTVRLDAPARRIVSLVPSATETLLALGAGDRLVGRTDYDIQPEVASVASVGGGIDPSLEKLAALRPDLVIGWETEGRPELRDQLEKQLGVPVLSVSVQDTADVYRTIGRLGTLTGRARQGDSVAAAVRAELDAVRASVAGLPRPTVFWMVQNDPPMTAGKGTFVTELIEIAGGSNVFADARGLWPSVSLEEIVRRQPEVVIVPVLEGRTGRVDDLMDAVGWRELRATARDRVHAVPTEEVNRPGPGLGKAARIVRDVIHPEAGGR